MIELDTAEREELDYQMATARQRSREERMREHEQDREERLVEALDALPTMEVDPTAVYGPDENVDGWDWSGEDEIEKD